ncbi:TetR/AcrR family transcriptional regulator [Litchfieldia salsa]|uniref:DNA-binding transcriptional regulator, AcrR family n=1 Tax=Litchfieldia salsa TaxID=930152 RepID=A0A1H0U9L1_9BACI|nr:TetR/AcrR family transcriptional regulator [Litchfieldia salsa]SDP62685.1 DNA-binding transcriptional regulator, AcrR family [Litchfieldia salsa]
MVARGNSDDKAIQETKHTIISAAQRLFMTYGYRSVSTRQIADSCGLTQPALYHHFQNKQTIYIEVVKSMMERTETALLRIYKRYNCLEERLEQVTYYMLMNHHEDLTQMFHDVRHEMDANNQILIRQWWMKSYLDPVILMLSEEKENGTLKELESLSTNETEMAYFILDMIKSSFQLSVKQHLNPTEKKKEAQRKAALVVKIFLDGISKGVEKER